MSKKPSIGSNIYSLWEDKKPRHKEFHNELFLEFEEAVSLKDIARTNPEAAKEVYRTKRASKETGYSKLEKLKNLKDVNKNWHLLSPEEKNKIARKMGFGDKEDEEVKEGEKYDIVYKTSTTPDDYWKRDGAIVFTYFPKSKELLYSTFEHNTHRDIALENIDQYILNSTGKMRDHLERYIGDDLENGEYDVDENRVFYDVISDYMYYSGSYKNGMVNGRYLNGSIVVWVYIDDQIIKDIVNVFEKDTGKEVEEFNVPSESSGQNEGMGTKENIRKDGDGKKGKKNSDVLERNKEILQGLQRNLKSADKKAVDRMIRNIDRIKEKKQYDIIGTVVDKSIRKTGLKSINPEAAKKSRISIMGKDSGLMSRRRKEEVAHTSRIGKTDKNYITWIRPDDGQYILPSFSRKNAGQYGLSGHIRYEVKFDFINFIVFVQAFVNQTTERALDTVIELTNNLPIDDIGTEYIIQWGIVVDKADSPFIKHKEEKKFKERKEFESYIKSLNKYIGQHSKPEEQGK